MASLVFLVLVLLGLVVLFLFLAALDRSATPPAERLSCTQWSTGDLARTTALGLRRLGELYRRQQDVWDLYLDQLKP
jgi:hypothetical protein